jgi:hypothetical protein
MEVCVWVLKLVHTEVKLTLCLNKHHVMIMYEEMEIQFHTFLTWMLKGAH